MPAEWGRAAAVAARRRQAGKARLSRHAGARRACAVLVVLGALLRSPPAPADATLMAGAGIYRFTNGFAWQLALAAPGLRHTRVHYTRWEDNGALAIAHELRLGPLNVSPGIGRLSHASDDIERRTALHLEIGWQLTERIRCQVTHFSSAADDQGENLLLCGLRFR